MDQLTVLCIINSFNMKNNFYIDSMDVLHFEEKKTFNGFISFWGKIICFYNKSLKI